MTGNLDPAFGYNNLPKRKFSHYELAPPGTYCYLLNGTKMRELQVLAARNDPTPHKLLYAMDEDNRGN